MKHLLFILFVVLAANSNAQTVGKWSIGVGYTPSIQTGYAFAIYLNRHLGNKWQVGLTPFVWYDKNSATQTVTANSTSLGLNLTSRFTPIQLNMFKPYLYGRAGYGNTLTKYSNPNYADRNEDYVNFSLGIGTEVSISNGWAIDANLGYIKLDFIDSDSYNQSPILSIGVLKRFGKVKE